MNTNKHIFFNDEETADRFIKLYGGIISKDYTGFYRRYYGEKCKDKIIVLYRCGIKDIKDICKYIGLKKKKWNGHLCYLYE